MKVRGAQIVFAAALAAALTPVSVGCGSDPGPPLEPVSLGLEADGSSVSLKPGQELVISLEGNPTAGFSWAVLDVDGAVLTPIGEPVSAPSSTDSTLVGGGGTFTLRFKAVAQGATKLELGYGRSWETAVPPEKTFSVGVTVK